ncbi:NAD-dependent succinate-semialdehyde dehydrogenase [Aliiglaciecola sp. 2_MG-2023]|uniref:NAD-dependent succinate-semialdehyde dehydrogenase n=1 Tax=unclassified Aliiglaciecola TaxID=2593648 RepID=UPI0026E4754D|nr:MULTISPECIES: NAD-dependent succinate-semialdehyde dehydrogenase [unclassified Aliiglaciecola]MDO6711686.1 NAD-dependent succinate-semialdehyde dehydrogenase [Aliiglaciecola sp. 2_MG-2023]MDO6752757.1 NAD-dependent succinate-semialdehyde dehydrogenase [Aliiglaciecola sp. 1_MG-2023]
MLSLKDPLLLKTQLFINGEWVKGDSGSTFPILNPATGTEICKLASGNKNDTNIAIQGAQSAMQKWRQTTAKHRAKILQKWHALIIENIDDLASILCAEQGKPLAEAKGEILYGAAYIEWFAEEAKRIYGDVIPSNNASQRLLTIKQAIGVVAAITPWNFPNAMITRKVAPALAAGCAVVLKPAEATPLSALALAELAKRAGLPKGLLSIVVGADAIEIGKALTDSSLVRKLSFTGSTKVGKLLIKQCADTVKKTSMELGGNAPFVVFEDADIDKAVQGAIASKFRNAGQTCVCANRFLVQRSIYQEFTDKFVAEAKKLKVGNGNDEGITIGPLINAAAAQNVHGLVTDAEKNGATKVLGGAATHLGANYYLPTILTNVTPQMRIFKEEIFGPVAPIIPFDTEEQALELANATEAGLASYVYTQNYARIWRFSENLENGIVGINEGIISSEVAPFGGIKQSGNGREGSKYGIDDYIEIKYLCMGGI